MSDAITADRLLRIEQVEEQTGLSSSTIYKWQSEDRFPRAVLLGARASRWVQSEVTGWIDRQRAEGQRATFRASPPAPAAVAVSSPRQGRGRPRKV